MLSQCDVAIVQHEYGIYGGADGDEVLDAPDALDVPAIVVAAHRAARPTAAPAVGARGGVRARRRVVVMIDDGRSERLLGRLRVDASKVMTIPHGAHRCRSRSRSARQRRRPVRELLTWGLLGPGKGIEHVIDARRAARRPRSAAALHRRRRDPPEGVRRATATVPRSR